MTPSLRQSLAPFLVLFGGVLVAASSGGCYIDLTPVGPFGPMNDADGDGFGLAGDCDDENAQVFPGADERCNDGIDNDCDGKIDAADPECSATTAGQGGSGGSGQGGSGGSGQGGSGGSGQGGAGGSGGSGQGGSGGQSG